MNCARRYFYQYANHLPNHLLSIDLKYPDFFLSRFDLIRFILYYFVQAELFHANLRFQKEKKLRGNVVFTTTEICILFRFTYAYMQITVHPPDFAGDKNIDFEFPNACLLGQPFYFGYQDFKS